jgi:hypothetical protein
MQFEEKQHSYGFWKIIRSLLIVFGIKLKF